MRSPGLVAGSGALLAQPGSQEFSTRIGAGGNVESGAVGVLDGGVDVRAVAQKVLGGAALATVAGLPERLADLSSGRESAAMSSSRRGIRPSAAACQSLSTRAPRSTRRRATCQQPYPIALSSGVPIGRARVAGLLRRDDQPRP
jgi:hypothetical protein